MERASNDPTHEDLVRRLRATGGKGQCGPLKAEAADEIERLGQIIERLRVEFLSDCETIGYDEDEALELLRAVEDGDE